MAALPARVVGMASLILWWWPDSAQADIGDCQPPVANFLSQAYFSNSNKVKPNTANNVSHHLGGYRTGTEATYQCDPGFVLIGDAVRVCNESRWSGAAPHCYQNVAERSSLTVNHRHVADGDPATSKSLFSLFSGEAASLSINLYFPTRIMQVRVIADQKIEGIKMNIQFMNGNARPFGTTADLSTSRLHGPHTSLAEFVAFKESGSSLQEVDALLLSLPSLRTSLWQPNGARVYEIQIIAESTGLSWRQCQEEVGNQVTPTQSNTWAVGNWCYHLVEIPHRNQHDAERICHKLGENGTLYRPGTGLNNLTIDMLSAVDNLRRHDTKFKTRIWIHGQEDNETNGDFVSSYSSLPTRCRALSPHTGAFRYVNCKDKHPYVCQRLPRLCGRFPREAGLFYSPPERTWLRGDTATVTCDDPGLTTGQIRCLAPDWTSPDFCRPTLLGGARPPRRTRLGGVLGAILGGAVGGAIVLAALAVFVIRSRNGRQQRQRQKQHVPPLDNSSEFLGLAPNPIYGDSGNEDEHLYSEVSNPEAIYEECSYAAPAQQSSPEPPPPPATRPSVGSLPDNTAPPPPSPNLEYGVFPMESVSAHPEHSQTAEQSVNATSAATPATSAQVDPDYEPCPVESQTPSSRTSGLAPAFLPSVTQTLPENQHHPTMEYAVPLVGGKPADGRQRNSSFAERSPGDGPEHVSVGGEAEYALPYRASVNAARRSIPDVAMVAMSVDAAGPA